MISSGRKVAIDASMSIYQFLIAVRQDGNMLTNSEGETTRSVADYLINIGRLLLLLLLFLLLFLLLLLFLQAAPLDIAYA